MKRDSRLSGVLHALLHMGQVDGPMTSDQLAACLRTNPVVVRRTMAGLREAGLVLSEKGHGGGWRLGRPLSGITLRDVHTALGEPALTPESPAVESPGCLVEAAVNRSLEAAYAEMFAHMAPERAEALRRRGAEIGFSRAVCRMNRLAEVRDGLAVGRAVYDAAVRDPDFAAAFAAARAEVEAARAEGLANPGCAAERLSLEDLRPGGG